MRQLIITKIKKNLILITIFSVLTLVMICCEKNEDNDPDELSESLPVGSVDYGNDANYSIKGKLVDANGNGLPGDTLELCLDGTISSLLLKTDEQGNYEFKGLPELLIEHEFDLTVSLVNDKFERTILWPIAKYNFDNGFPPEESMVIPTQLTGNNIGAYEIDKNTKISGTIIDTLGNPIPADQIELIDLTKGAWIYTQGPAFNEPDNVYFMYDENSGQYSIEKCLSGAELNYKIHLIFKESSSFQDIESQPIEIIKGQVNISNLNIFYKP